MEQERYNYYKELHPEWTDEDIWLAISLDKQAKDAIKEGGNDVDVTTPEFINQIILKAQEWIEHNLPIIFEKVKAFFTKALDTLVDWARKGWEYLLGLIGESTIY